MITHPFTLRFTRVGSLLSLIASLFAGFCGDTPAAEVPQNIYQNFQYDANGNLTRITNAQGNYYFYAYDQLNRQISEVRNSPLSGGMQGMVKYEYDGADQLSRVTDARSIQTKFVMDGNGYPEAIYSADSGSSSKTFDEAGNLRSSTDALKRVTTYSYDALNRVTKIAYANLVPTKFEYDGGVTAKANAIGRLTKIVDSSGSTTFDYDQRGRIVAKIQSVVRAEGTDIRSTRYAYGTNGAALGKLVDLIYPSGNRISYDYNVAGQIEKVTLHTTTGASNVIIQGIKYSPLGIVQSWTWGNNRPGADSYYVRKFDVYGRIATYPLGSVLAQGLVRNLQYDAAGRIIGFVHMGLSRNSPLALAADQTFSYDDLGRLNKVVSATSSQSYAYDLNGNRTAVQIGANGYSYVVATTSNRLVSTSGPLPARSFSYNAVGSLSGDKLVVYTYREDGRLGEASFGVAGHASYSYNGLGQRVSKSSTIATGGTNVYVYDRSGRLLGEYISKGAALQETVYLGDQPVAVLVPNKSETDHYYVFADHLNSPRVITRSTDNAIVWRWDNDNPFGGAPIESFPGRATFVYNLRFPGQLFDKETNTHYNNFRDYDPQTGRYLQSDPVGIAGGLNTYAYVANNPLSYSDPSGLCIGPLFVACVFVAENTPAILAVSGVGVSIFTGADVPAPASTAGKAARIGGQYALRAAQAGWYPIMTRGSKAATGQMWCEAGDVWKFGTTLDFSKRYSQRYLDSIGTGGVYMDKEFVGTSIERLILENAKLFNYVGQNGHLPPGNKIGR